jgi:hypothetical protein
MGILFKGFSRERRPCLGGVIAGVALDADAGEGASGGTYGHAPDGVDARSGTRFEGRTALLCIGHDG